MTDDLIAFIRHQLAEHVAMVDHLDSQGEQLYPTADEQLADVEAKRRILDEYDRLLTRDPLRSGDYWDGCRDALRSSVVALAQPLAGRPGWREEWKVDES